MATVAVIGNAIVDEVHRPGVAVEEEFGGNGFNLAITLASLGVDTWLVARISRDKAGIALVDALRHRGVNLWQQGSSGATERVRVFLTDAEPHYEFSSFMPHVIQWTPGVIDLLRSGATQPLV